jgi:hypothetical protein
MSVSEYTMTALESKAYVLELPFADGGRKRPLDRTPAKAASSGPLNFFLFG